MAEDNKSRSALSEISDLVRNVNYGDMFFDVAISMSEIIVKGRRVDYIFKPDPELPGYYAENSNLWLTELRKSLLQRSGLIEVNENHSHGTLIRPTQKALELYERLRQEKRLDNEGYLDSMQSTFF